MLIPQQLNLQSPKYSTTNVRTYHPPYLPPILCIVLINMYKFNYGLNPHSSVKLTKVPHSKTAQSHEFLYRVQLSTSDYNTSNKLIFG